MPETRVHVLVVEDDATLREGLRASFRNQGWRVEAANDGDEAVEFLGRDRFDCVVLDLMLPKRSGLEVLRWFRDRDRDTPVIILTARAEESEKVLGLELGADDYVTKPFGLRELIARVRARTRHVDRAEDTSPGQVSIGPVTVDFDAFTWSRDGGDTETLSRKEAGILALLWTERGKAVDRDRILDEVWGRGVVVSHRTIDTHVLNLRNKLEQDPKEPQHLKTVHGIGYRLDP